MLGKKVCSPKEEEALTVLKRTFGTKYRCIQPSFLGGVSVSENLKPHNGLWNLCPLECPYCRIPCFELKFSEQAATGGDEVFTFIRTVF